MWDQELNYPGSSEDDDDIPYNPKNLPLGWDGKVGGGRWAGVRWTLESGHLCVCVISHSGQGGWGRWAGVRWTLESGDLCVCVISGQGGWCRWAGVWWTLKSGDLCVCV